MKAGRVYLVGGGPGDPRLITLRGRDLLRRADVVVYDRLVSPRLLEEVRPEAETVYAGKQPARHTLRQEQINALLVDRARRGLAVVRLKGGDPFVFGRGGEEAMALAEAGIAFEIVPGITAGAAAPACAGIPVTHRGIASGVALMTGHEDPTRSEPGLDLAAAAGLGGTLIFYMGVSRVELICSQLAAHGLTGETPAAVIERGATARQRVVTAALADLPRRVEEAGIEPPAVIVVGEVVRLRDRLEWFERRPLFGRRIVVTRPAAQARPLVERIEELGGEAVEMPAIRIEPPGDPAPLRDAVTRLFEFDWVALTSTNAVEALCRAVLDAGLDARAFARCRIAAIGPATADALGGLGLRADLTPPTFTTAALADALVEAEELGGKRVLLPRSDIAPPELGERLAARGATVHEVTAYRTVPDGRGAAEVRDLLARRQIAWLTFTSGSTVGAFFDRIDPQQVRQAAAGIASIGPGATDALAKLDLPPDVQAETHTAEGLLAAIVARELAGGAPG